MGARGRSAVAAMMFAAGLVIVAAGTARGGDDHSVPYARPESSTSGMFEFYAGSIVRVGEFPGKLVCLRCDLMPGPEAMKRCEKEGHRHALSMEGDSMIHPLLAVSKDVLEQINSGELHGKEVVVMIAVDRIAEPKGGAER